MDVERVNWIGLLDPLSFYMKLDKHIKGMRNSIMVIRRERFMNSAGVSFRFFIGNNVCNITCYTSFENTH